ncbi:MAG: hypothetical protein EOP35_00570 [Rubrivivax sp.]|nr:MAG: hypothetical protein EOP35_00570 [Rubrivivax sp.]
MGFAWLTPTYGLSFLAATWLQAVLGLPSVIIKSRSGFPSDVVTLAVALPLLIAYLYARMLRGK